MSAVGRGTDESVTWYLHKRLNELLAQGAKQTTIAERTGQPKSAVNLLVNHGQGAGSVSVANYVELLGFKTRGELIDAADAWWSKEGNAYVVQQLREIQRKREEKAALKGAARIAGHEINEQVERGVGLERSQQQKPRRDRHKAR
ncbi:MAG TPA: hypothetical protein VIM73_10955 [Polyangiaceae bacterium]